MYKIQIFRDLDWGNTMATGDSGSSMSGGGVDWSSMAPALLNIGGGLLGNLFNAGSQTGWNNSQRDWAGHMYDVQRQDALADRAFENNYNSPAAQMERLKAAGLNPNLVYGSGNATQGSAAVRSSNPGSYSPKAPQVEMGGIGSALMLMYNVMKTQAETDNIRAATDLAKQNVLVAETQADRNRQEITRSSTLLPVDVQREQSVIGKTNADAARVLAETEKIPYEIAKLKVDTKFTIDQNVRAAKLNNATIEKMLQEKLLVMLHQSKTEKEIDQIKYATEHIKTEVNLKQFELNQKFKGIYPSDNMLLRLINEAMQKWGQHNWNSNHKK